MANERTFDPQLSPENEAVAVQDFETGSFSNKQMTNDSTGNAESNTGGSSSKDAQSLIITDDSLKEKHPEKKDTPKDESFKVFTPEITGCLLSDAILYSVEKVPLKSLISEDRKSEESLNKEALKLQVLSFFSEVSVPWSYQDEANRIEKKKEEDFNAKNQLPEQLVGRLTIKEESKNWYKIAFSGNEGYVEKKHIEIEALDWLTKSHQKETSDETIKSEKKKALDEKLKTKEAENIKKEEKTTKGSDLKRKIIDLSKVTLQITSEEKKLQDVKEAFEKRLKKKKEDLREGRKQDYIKDIRDLTKSLKEKIDTFNTLNLFIKTEREKLLTEEEKAIVKEYKIKILDEQEEKKKDHLDPEVIIKDIENKVLMSSDELKQYEEGKKQQKIKELEQELEDPKLDDKKKAEKQEEIKKINNPTPDTKPEDFARKEILLYADRQYQTPLGLPEKKALLHYLMKASELTKEEKRGLFNFMVLFFKDGDDDVARINEVFGYDGDKIDPKAFTEKFSDLEFTMPSDLVREELNKNKETYKIERKRQRKMSTSFEERRARRQNLKADFKEKRKAIKAPRRSLKEQSKDNRQNFRADKRKNRKNKSTDKNYKDTRSTRKSEFKDKRREIREEKRKNPVFLRSLWQKSRNDSKDGSWNEQLNYLAANRSGNQGVVAMVRDNKFKRKSISAIQAADKQTLAFWGIIEHNPNFYLDAYELESLRRTEGDTEKLQLKSIQFYERYFKGNPGLGIGYQNPFFDLDPTLFYKFIILPGLLFKAFPAKYYQNDIPSKPSEVKDDQLRFFYADDFARFEQKDESLKDSGKGIELFSEVESNIKPDKLNVDWFEFIQANPGNYMQAYELEKFLDQEGVPLSEKQEKLFAFYKLYEKQFNKGGAGFANKEDLWAKWSGDPTGFFKYLYPAKYFKDDKLVPPTQVYMDLWDALQTGILDTLLEESALKSIGNDLGKKTGNHLGKNYLAYGIPTFLGLAGSDLLFEDSNFYSSFPGELGILPAYFTTLVPLNKTLIDYKRTTPWGNNLSSIQHKLRVSNQPFDEKGILPTYPSPPGRSGEFKPGQNSLANYQAMFETDPKKMLPSVYGALNYEFLKNRTENSKLMNQTTLSATGFGQFFTPMGAKLGGDKKTYSMLAQGYSIIGQNTPDFSFNKDTTWKDLSLAKFTGREKNEAYLNSMPDDPVFNFGAGLSVAHRPSKNLGLSTSLNYAGVNAIPGMNDFKRMDLWSGKTGISINANPIGYWKVNANLNYDWAYTRDLTPNPNSTNQDAVNGIGQQHTLSGNLTIGNGFCEFTGAFSDDLMRGKDATTFTLRFSVNQFADIPKGVFSAQVFMEKRAPVPSLGIPSVLSGGVKLVFQLGNILPNQPK